jgi:hypothetical protein
MSNSRSVFSSNIEEISINDLEKVVGGDRWWDRSQGGDPNMGREFTWEDLWRSYWDHAWRRFTGQDGSWWNMP